MLSIITLQCGKCIWILAFFLIMPKKFELATEIMRTANTSKNTELKMKLLWVVD